MKFLRAFTNAIAIQPPGNVIADERWSKFATALTVGLHWRPTEDGDTPEAGRARFIQRVTERAPEFHTSFKKLKRKGDYDKLGLQVERFINLISTLDTVDAEYPLIVAPSRFEKNSFIFVRLLKSIIRQTEGQDSALGLGKRLFEAQSRPSRFLFGTALAQMLFEAGQLREAADTALKARDLRGYDLCTSKTVYATQKALYESGAPIDVEFDFSDTEQRFCSMPYKLLNIHSRHSDPKEEQLLHGLCQCRGWLPVTFEFKDETSWNDARAMELRESILDGSFKYCDALRCPHIRNGMLPRLDEVEEPEMRRVIEEHDPKAQKGPEKLILAYDRSCNLSCPSCRDGVFMADLGSVAYLDERMGSVEDAFLPTVERLHLTQVGEALASAHFRRLFKKISPEKYPNLGITLMSNTKLLSQTTWDKLGPASDCIDLLVLSVDGATPATLEKTRRGLKWEELISGLEFTRELILDGKVKSASIMCVLQKDNMHEMPQMIELCSTYLIERLTIYPIAGHGEYSLEEFAEINVNRPDHRLNPELRRLKAEALALIESMKAREAEIIAEGKIVPHLQF